MLLWLTMMSSWQPLVQAFLTSNHHHPSSSKSLQRTRSKTDLHIVFGRTKNKRPHPTPLRNHETDMDTSESTLFNEGQPPSSLSKEDSTSLWNKETTSIPPPSLPQGDELVNADFWKMDPSDAFGSMLLQLQQQEQQQEEGLLLSNDHDEQGGASNNNKLNTQNNHDTTDNSGASTTSSMAAAVLNNILKQQDATKKRPTDSTTNKHELDSTGGTRQQQQQSTYDHASSSEEPLASSSSTADSKKASPPPSSSSSIGSSSTSPSASSSTFSVSLDIAKELDNSVNTLSKEDWQKLEGSEWIQQELSLDPEYTTTATPKYTRTTSDDATLRQELRLLAVSTASRTESVEQWCEQVSPQIGGIHPLLETIQEGARQAVVDPANVDEGLEHACVACRTLRDLCALSPELAACLTDSVLRYNQQTNNHLPIRPFLQDVCQLLSLAGDTEGTLQHDAPKQWFVIPDKRGRLFRSHRRRRRRRNNNNDSGSASSLESNAGETVNKDETQNRKSRRLARYKSQLYILQVLLTMTTASDDAVQAIRACPGLTAAISKCSSYTPQARRQRWWRYLTTSVRSKGKDATKKKSLLSRRRRPFMEAAVPSNDLQGEIQKTANQVLAAIG